MSSMLRFSLVGAVWVVDTLRLRRLASAVLQRAPWLRVRLSRLQLRVGDDHGLVQVPQAELQARYQAALAQLDGSTRLTYLEFGVYLGTSMTCMYRAAQLEQREVRLVGFDSFQGLPASATQQDGPWRAGMYRSDVELTRTNLRRNGVPLEAVELVPGWYEDSLTDATRQSLGLERADIVMIDCDLESSAREALDFCTPLIQRTFVFFDDWSVDGLDERHQGERSAFEAWLAAHPEMEAQERPELQYDARARAFLVSRSR